VRVCVCACVCARTATAPHHRRSQLNARKQSIASAAAEAAAGACMRASGEEPPIIAVSTSRPLSAASSACRGGCIACVL
jgi:hypothetical protein